MTKQMLVSIIINNYNYARFLAEAIDSALAQTYPRTEVIVVDDGSTDSSRDVIARYGDRILPVLKENGGQASALNAGFAHGRGDVIIFLDADDILLPDTARWAAEVFAARPASAKVMYRMAVVDGSGQLTGAMKPQPHLRPATGDLRRQILTFPDDLTWMSTSGNAFPAWVLRRIFPIPEQEYRILADWYLAHLAPLFGPVVFLDAPGALYRVHGGNNYEPGGAELNLRNVRQSIVYAHATHRHIVRQAKVLSLLGRPRAPHALRSGSFLANRLISLRLAPREHPLPGDRPWRVALLGLVTTLQRRDLGLPLRVAFLLWFSAMVLAPRRLAYVLGRWMIVPETRPWVNRASALLAHR